MRDKLIGIDLGGTSVKMAVLTLDGCVEHQWLIPTDTSDGGSRIVPVIIASIKEKLAELALPLSAIKGIGMGSPGQVDRKKGTVIGAYNLGWSTEQDVKSAFEEAFSSPFFIDNDANVAALGEGWKGAGENASDVIFITLGTGVGGGIVADGRLLHGARGSAGEIGHMTVEPDGFECTCGNRGCLETVASATGLVNLAGKLVDEKDTSELAELIRAGQASAKTIFDMAKAGDRLALTIVDQFAFYLGLSCSQLANVLNPFYIVIGGGVSAAGDFLLEKVEEQFLRFAFPTVRQSTKLALATLGNDAGVIGAARLVLD